MFRTIPPSAAPIQFKYLIKGMVSTLCGKNSLVKFQNQIKEYFKIKHVILISSGKAAIYLALTALSQISERREVIIPAYSSYCLASAVARTGLPIRLCDIDPSTLDFDLSKLKLLINEKTLAIIPVHIYGLVCNLEEIKKLAVSKGAWIIEDAAQAAGALLEDLKVGTIGDIGILSFGRGKNICALGGGVILTSQKKIASSIIKILDNCPRPPLLSGGVSGYVTGIALSLFLNPERYFIPANFPFLGLGANIFHPQFKITRFPDSIAAAEQQTFINLNRYNEIRNQNALMIQNSIYANNLFSIPKPGAGISGRSVYLRFPIIFIKSDIRSKAFKLLNSKRLGASCSYPEPLNQISEFRRHIIGENDFSGARFVADRILTLPTHPYIKDNDLKQIILTINELTRIDNVVNPSLC